MKTMSRARDWEIAAEELREFLNPEAPPVDQLALGKTTAHRLREWQRRVRLGVRRVMNCAELWLREEYRRCPECNVKTKVLSEGTVMCGKCGREW